MTDMIRVRDAAFALDEAVQSFERECIAAGAYMPGIATRLRIHADEMAEKYPDDNNGGARHD